MTLVKCSTDPSYILLKILTVHMQSEKAFYIGSTTIIIMFLFYFSDLDDLEGLSDISDLSDHLVFLLEVSMFY